MPVTQWQNGKMSNTSAGPDTQDATQVDFESLKLIFGATLQIQNLKIPTQKFSNLKLYGVIKGKSIIISQPYQEGVAALMPKGASFIVRGFNGRHAFAFTSHVIQACTEPFAYVHMSYPPNAESKTVRNAQRVNVNMPGFVALNGERIPVNMLDLSAKGSMLETPQSVGGIGDSLQIEFEIEFDGGESRLNLPAKIKNACYLKDSDSMRVGVEFHDISQNETLLLNSFILANSTLLLT
jgi:c-di-GMP-binding flagellar brake protein YcgR